jgi:hypothetical protein
LEAAAIRTSRDLENRAAGLAARTLGSLTEKPAPSDDVLAARVSARVGRLVSHPGAIEVSARAGVVTLSGPIFDSEVGRLISGVHAVAGVKDIDNHLEPHAEAGDISALQGPGPLTGEVAPAEWMHWTPTTRLMAGAVGVALMALAVRARTIGGTAATLAGFEILEEAVRARQ